ncbi:MAG: hypothetical protein KJO77_03165 [Bacteroidia bacterium]|nr:hypothetical protein [Bacteroidia bacterium]
MGKGILNIKSSITGQRLLIFLCLFSSFSFAQVKSSIDSTSIKIGEQITYKIEVESDTTDMVIFPEGQSFLPLEVIEAYDIDSTLKNAKYQLIKKYGLTQFDSGSYTIPQQTILIGDKRFFTDSLKVEVRTVEVDTTKQKLYDIKPIFEVEKSSGNWLRNLIFILLALALIGFLVYWFVWRKKPLSVEEKIALLPPYERAKMALQELERSSYLENDEIKSYYSELTLIIRKYLDEKVYDHSLESTTEELINRLQLLKDGNQIDLDAVTIANFETIFRRADLVKFAKARPDKELAKIDRDTIDLEIDHVKESLPEPTEEERLADMKYREEQAKKKRRKQIIITAAVAVLLLIGTFVGFSLHYGFNYVKDSILGHPTKKLLEQKEWVTSEYGAPGIIITTPEVLERVPSLVPEELKERIQDASFQFLSTDGHIKIELSNTRFILSPEEEKQFNNEEEIGKDLLKASEGYLAKFEEQGATNISVRREQFITPNGQEGIKTFGSMDIGLEEGDEKIKTEYVLLHFRSKNVRQQIVMLWMSGDVYADQIIERVSNSVELLKLEEKDK